VAGAASHRTTAILRDLKKQGWNINPGVHGNHYKCYPPGGDSFVVISTTAGGGRAEQNTKAMIRRAERGFYERSRRERVA